MASQLADAVYQVTTAELDGGTFLDRPATFKATGKVLSDKGWKRLYMESTDDDEEDPQAANPVPVLQQGAAVAPERGEVLAKQTSAPKRFTEATLIAELERHGVGRPSTYASIIHVLFARRYIQKKADKPPLYPTDLGGKVIDALVPFHFADVDYTRSIEETLDSIAQGQAQGRDLLQKAWDDLQETMHQMPAGAGQETTPCPIEGCTGQVRRLESKKKKGSFFWACSNKDHGLLADENGQPGKPFGTAAKVEPGPDCPKCKKPTGQFSTKNGKPYYRCSKCGTAWWPGENDTLGKKWSKK